MFELFKWALALASLAGVVLNVRRDRRSFALWMATNASWCLVDLHHEVYQQSLLHLCYFVLAVWGFIAWKK